MSGKSNSRKHDSFKSLTTQTLTGGIIEASAYYLNGVPLTPGGGTPGTVTNITTGTGLTGGPITTTGSISLANTSVIAGAYLSANVTINAQGQIIAAANGAQGTVTNIATGTGLTGGPITSTGTISMANTAVTPGTYTLATVTVDQQGRITAAANGSGGTGTVTSVATGIGLSGGPITTSGTIRMADTAVTPGTYIFPTITVDQQGRITAAANNTSPGTGTVTSVASGTGLTGGPITTTGTLNLADTAVTPGSYTLASITVDQQGRLTAASSGSLGTTQRPLFQFHSGTTLDVASTNIYIGPYANSATFDACALVIPSNGTIRKITYRVSGGNISGGTANITVTGDFGSTLPGTIQIASGSDRVAHTFSPVINVSEGDSIAVQWTGGAGIASAAKYHWCILEYQKT